MEGQGDEKKGRSFERFVEGKLGFEGDVDYVLVTTAQAPGKEPTTLTHQVTTEALEIAKAITTTTGVDLQPEYFKVVKETVERSKWLGAGIKLSVDILSIFHLLNLA